jgi:hypothetical protein
MLLVRLFAAVCAADSIDEKKPVLVDALGVGSSVSMVGERGAVVTLESLLGPRLIDPDLLLLCVLIIFSGELPSATEELWLFAVFRPVKDSDKERRGSVGEGGVLTIEGVDSDGFGGVRGGFWPKL